MTFPLPRLEDIVDSVGQADAEIYSVFDLANSFWQIKLDESTKHKTGFVTHQGVYNFKYLSFGMKNSPAVFNKALSEVLRGLTWKHTLTYVDDILIYSKNFTSHLTHLKQVFDRLKSAGLKLKPPKCNFAAKQVTYLGHIFSKNGISVDHAKTKVVSDFPMPRN